MKKLRLALIFGIMSVSVMAQYNRENPLTHTYSIVAMDTATGEIGVAVQSHWFSVGTVVAWAEAGVGAVATQSFSNPAFGPQGLTLMKTGLGSEATLKALLESDEGREYRQVGVIDASGKTAAHTGKKNIKEAGHVVGDYYAVQANLMENATVWGAMAKVFENSAGLPLAERLILALEAAQKEGGDIRGKQSAAVLVVSGEPTGKSWIDRKVDLRVDDHEEPLKEIRRLWEVHQAYTYMNDGDVAVEEGDFEKATELYKRAETMFPNNLEMQYWHAINLANTNKLTEALPMFKKIFALDPKWKTLTPRLIDNGMLTVSEGDLKKIMKQ